MNKLRPIVLGFLITLLLTGCASERYKAQAKREKELAAKEGYVWYTPVGTNIAIKVPKDEAKASAAETEETEDIFRDLQRRVQKPEDGPQTGIPGAQHVGEGK